MQAIQLKQYGGPEQLAEVDVPTPAAGPGQVVVRVFATSYNPLDAKLASGQMQQMMPLTFPFVPGGDFSGVVESVGDGVTGRAVGDEVFGYAMGGGAYAERLAVDAGSVAPKPRTVGHVEAASVPVVGLAAIQALAQAGLQAGETVLIQGAGGAVGGMAVQIAHKLGARVIASADAASAERLRGYGADTVIDYKTTPFESVAEGVDVVLDGVGGDVQQRSLAVLRPGGRLVALTQPPSPDEATQRGVTATMVQTASSTQALEDLAGKIDAGELRPFVGRTYPLSAVAQAWTDVRSEHIAGKIVFVATE